MINFLSDHSIAVKSIHSVYNPSGLVIKFNQVEKQQGCVEYSFSGCCLEDVAHNLIILIKELFPRVTLVSHQSASLIKIFIAIK